MTLFQFWAVSAFVIGCIIITYLNNRKMIKVLKQRDRLAQAVLDLVHQVGWYYPEGIHESDPCVVKARAAVQAVLRDEKVKQ